MANRLKAPQRLWLLFTVALFASTIALSAAVWPPRNPAIMADLAAPECLAWLRVPEGQLPATYPATGDPCHAVASLVYRERVAIRSVADYDAYLSARGRHNALVLFLIWATVTAGTYVLAWVSSRGTGALLRRRDRAEVAGGS